MAKAKRVSKAKARGKTASPMKDLRPRSDRRVRGGATAQLISKVMKANSDTQNGVAQSLKA